MKVTQKKAHILIHYQKKKKSYFYKSTPILQVLKRITSKVLEIYMPAFTEVLTRCVHQAKIQISQNVHPLYSIYMQ